MSKAVLSRKAAAVKGALAVALAPKMLAMDAKLNFGAILAGITSKNFTAELPAIKARLKAETAGKLAQDATLDDVNLLLDKLTPDDPTVMDDDIDPDMTVDDGEDERDAFLESMKAKMSPEEHAKLCEMLEKKGIVGDADETPEAKAAREKAEADRADKPMTKQAMDAAIAAGITAATNATISRMAAVREAEKVVRPYIGELAMAQDDAATVYRMALDHLKVVHKDIKETAALKALVQIHPVPGTRAQPQPRLAHDAAATSAVATKHPELAAVRVI